MSSSPLTAAFEQRREALVARLERLTREDERIAALWLQGSLAAGTADALSDVDAYLAVVDEQFDAVYGARRELAELLGALLFSVDSLIPGLLALHCVVEGPVKLNLFFERASQAPNVDRPAVRLLVDKTGLEPRLKRGWRPSVQSAAQRLQAVFSGTRQGCTWPVRLLLRGQWCVFTMVELEVINDNLALLMAVQTDPALLFHNRLSYPRLLRPEQRDKLDRLTQALLAAVVRRDLGAIRDVHLRINAAIVREGRAAYAALDLTYPGSEAGDAAIHAFYARLAAGGCRPAPGPLIGLGGGDAAAPLRRAAGLARRRCRKTPSGRPGRRSGRADRQACCGSGRSSAAWNRARGRRRAGVPGRRRSRSRCSAATGGANR